MGVVDGEKITAEVTEWPQRTRRSVGKVKLIGTRSSE